MPLPVTDLFKILSVFGNVLFVLNQLVVHLLHRQYIRDNGIDLPEVRNWKWEG